MDPSGTANYTYDNRDRLLTKATPQGTLSYTYQPNRLVASVVSSNANGANIGYSYDSLNRLQTVTDNRLANSTTMTYNDASEPLTMAYPNGVTRTSSHDPNGRVSSLTNNRGASYNYARRLAGAIETATETARTVNYGYDLVQKLLSESITPNNWSLTYTHDPVGNRLTRSSNLPGLPTVGSTYDADDRLTTNTYDSNGNTLASNGHDSAYDFEDRLTSYDSGLVTFVYDGDGNRVARTQGGAMTRYLIDDLTLTGYAQVAEEVVGGAVNRRYTHGSLRISQTQLITGNWTTYYYGYDGGGTVRQLFDASGAVTDTYDYDAYGTVITSTGATPNTYLYRGEHYDSMLDMYYLRARWYWPKVGRLVTADRFEGLTVKPLTTNAYLYADSSPTSYSDPSGHLRATSTWGPTIKVGVQFSSRMRLLRIGVAGSGVAAYMFTDFVWEAICALSKAGSAVENAHRLSEAVEGREMPPSSYLDPCRLRTKADDGEQKSNCREAMPNLIPCEQTGYSCRSESEAFNKLKAMWPGVQLKKHADRLADSGPCGLNQSQYSVGRHVNIRILRTNDRAGSLVGCSCCEDSPSGPAPKERWDVR